MPKGEEKDGETLPQATRPAEVKADDDAGRTIAAPLPKDAEAIKAAEQRDVAVTWNVGDAVLGAHEVKIDATAHRSATAFGED